jgi:predicted dehydrogenase
MSKSFRWGILGTGGIARTFARDLELLPGHEIGAVGSRTIGKAESFAAEFSGQAFGSYEALVESDVDAIYVATPHTFHAENSILALNAGKPVLCEKPFAVNFKEAEAMVAASKANQVALMEGMWSRFLPTYQVIREVVASGELGELVAIYADHGQALPADPYYRLHAPELAGGALLDLGIYPISLTFMVLGNPDSVLATSIKTESGVDAQTSFIFSYVSGQHSIMTTTLEVRTPCTAKIIGTRGRIEVDSNFYTPTSMRVIIDGRAIQEFPANYQGHGIREQAAHFAEIVRSGAIESPLMPHEESLAIMDCMDEIRYQIDLKYPFEDND